MNLSEVSLRTKDAFWNVQKTPIDSTEELGRFARFVADQTGLLGVERLLETWSCQGSIVLPRKKETPSRFHSPGFLIKSWHRPTLPYRLQYSTIGSEGLNFSVRNGKRCYTLDIDTRN